MAERAGGLSLGQLLLALDRTMVTLVEAPRGLDMPRARHFVHLPRNTECRMCQFTTRYRVRPGSAWTSSRQVEDRRCARSSISASSR